MKKLYLAARILFGLMFINAGLNKFFNYIPTPEDLPDELLRYMNAITDITWLMPLVGFGEVLGGILFMIPKTRALGAIVIFPIMIGIILTNIFASPSGLGLVFVLFAINCWVLVENKQKYLPLIND
jgi:uncharacterized membrane protein YphA (DoxX/SURF4 family)